MDNSLLLELLKIEAQRVYKELTGRDYTLQDGSLFVDCYKLARLVELKREILRR